MSAWTSRVRPLDAPRIFTTLAEHAVRHVVVGGLAAIAHGYTGLTQDADTVPDLADENLDRLAAALCALGAVLYAHPGRTDLAPDGSPPEAAGFEWSGAHLRTRLSWQFMTDAGPLDVLSVVDGPGGYEALIRHAEPRRVRDVEVYVASLDDLIESKEASARDKDLRALGELRRLRDARRSQS